jgi:hypothetical protein
LKSLARVQARARGEHLAEGFEEGGETKPESLPDQCRIMPRFVLVANWRLRYLPSDGAGAAVD